jgi:1,4-alpha-glucan branching enzyme
VNEPVGSCCVVLHTHLPWLAHHGSWPVGEEWLYQAWAGSYLPVVQVLERLAGQGRRDLLTLAVTPVLAAQLDDPYCLRQMHTWLGFWQARAQSLAASQDEHLRRTGAREAAAATRATALFEERWRHGGSPVLRRLVDSGAVELLGGPATHPFLPLMAERLASFSVRCGLDDAAVRFGSRPHGMWVPECGHRPGLESLYAAHGVDHVVLDGPTLLRAGRSTADAWTLGDTGVVAFGRDLDVTYRVWSPRRGYPGGPWYRDFHTFDHPSGLRPARVTSTRTPGHDKAPYDPDRARLAVDRDADDFVTVVRNRLVEQAARRDGRPGLVVVAYDTELFGHWWHEGPAFLQAVLTRLPAAGVRVTTLAGAVAAGHVGGTAEPGPGSWGSGKDWHVWAGAQVDDVVDTHRVLSKRLLELLDLVEGERWQSDLITGERRQSDGSPRPTGPALARRPDLDQLARDALLAHASDWAFMVTKDSATSYARDRIARHVAAFDQLETAILRGARGTVGTSAARAVADAQRAVDGPFAHMDARLLARPDRL